jgi:multidrug efflux pump subunit AcrA (membrane-fusion protein)
MLIVAAILALGVGYYVPQTFSAKPAIESVKSSTDGVKADSSAKPKATAKSGWATSAAGRVEPIGGEVRIGAQLPGRIAEMLVALNDKVASGDLLVRLDDEELIGRVNAALAEATVRKRERDNAESSTGKLAQDRRSAEDAVANAERQLVQNRDEFDRIYKARRNGQEADVDGLEAMLGSGKADGGMIPKLESCLHALRGGVRRAHILDGRIPHALLLEFFTREGIGTMIGPA